MFFQQYIPVKIFIFGIHCMEKITGQTIHRKAKACLVRFADAQATRAPPRSRDVGRLILVPPKHMVGGTMQAAVDSLMVNIILAQEVYYNDNEE